MCQQISANRDLIWRIFRERNPDGVAQAVAQQRADADGALDAAVLALAGFRHSQMNRIIPARPQPVQARDQQAVTFNHHLGIARFHRELEIMKLIGARDAGEFQRAFHHPHRRVAKAVHDAVAERTVVCADPQGAAQFLAEFDQRREFFLDALQLRAVLLVRVFLDRELLGIRIVARIDAHHLHPLGRFQGRVRLEMDVGHDRHQAITRAQFRDNIFQIRRVLHRRRGDAHNLAAHGDEFERLLHAQLRVHRVAGQHRLHDDGMVPADDDPAARGIAHHHLTGLSPAKMKQGFAIVHYG